MERVFPAKSVVLFANTANTIIWSAPDIGPRFYESIIKRRVSIRFTCSSTSPNSVNVGIKYTTLSKDYQIAERQTLFIIPPNNSIEVTPATIPALGLLYENIVSITANLISASAGTVTIALIIDDEPPPLTTDPGELKGLDSKFNQDYILVAGSVPAQSIAPGLVGIFTYTVPAGKRAYIDIASIWLEPTPSFPALLSVTVALTLSGYQVNYYSSDTDRLTFTVFNNLGYILPAGEALSFSATNLDTTNHTIGIGTLIREVY